MTDQDDSASSNMMDADFDELAARIDLSETVKILSEAFFPPAKAHEIPLTLFHYTSLEAALGIVGGQELRLTSCYHLNDTTEHRYGRGMLQQAAEAFTWESTALKDQILSAFKDTANVPCVFSLTPADDLLSQWRAYGNDPENPGLALGFETQHLWSSPSSARLNYADLAAPYTVSGLYRVIYDAVEQQKLIDTIISRINLHCQQACSSFPKEAQAIRFLFGLVFTRWVSLVASVIKVSGFREEQEWRIVTQVPLVSNKICFRRRGRLIVPFVNLKPLANHSLPIVRVVHGSILASDSISQASLQHLFLHSKYNMQKIAFTDTSLPLRSI